MSRRIHDLDCSANGARQFVALRDSAEGFAFKLMEFLPCFGLTCLKSQGVSPMHRKYGIPQGGKKPPAYSIAKLEDFALTACFHLGSVCMAP